LLQSILPSFAARRIVVAGDVILDEYLIGTATRMSREAPVPVLEFEQQRLIPGGAANPAANIIALGAHVRLVGMIGADSEATALRQVLQARGINTDDLVVDGARPTTVKTRILAQMGLRFPQQVARLDKLSRDPITPAIEGRAIDAVLRAAGNADALLLSDYGGGLLTPRLVDKARALGNHLLLTADAQGKFEKYAGFGVVKCNADEARAFLRRPLNSPDDYAAAARDLCSALKLTRGMVITRGADGATIATPDGHTQHCPAPAVSDVYDTVGAGDTAVAVLTLALAAGAALDEAATLANYASGLVVRRVGNYAPTADELVKSIENSQQD
jgi:D-glycero-beta-D-manno-heptose-7-phosphate kinase